MNAPRLATLLALALAVTACGGDEAPAPEQPAPASPATTVPAAAAQPDVQPLVVWIEDGSFTGKAPHSVEFKADVEGGTEPLTSTWDFGDGQTSTETAPTHVYTKAGTYEVRLEVKDSREGEADSDWDSVEVVVSE